MAEHDRVAEARAVAVPVAVLHVVSNLKIGGLERLLVDILRRTNREQIAARVLCLGEEGEMAEDVRRLGIPVEALGLPLRSNLRLPSILAGYCRRQGVDVLHAHGPYAHFYGALARVWHPRLRVISTRHGYLWPVTWKRRLQSRLAGSLSQRVVAVSRDLLKSERLPARKQAVIYNGLDPDRFTAAKRDGARIGPVAAMVARLSTEKDVPTLLRATAVVAEAVPDFELRIIGDGPQRGALVQLAKELGIERTVRFLGARRDVEEQLAQVRFFVLSTNTEGLSISILEAMASGLPVIATAVGGNPEVVVDGETGYLVPPRSPQRLAERMLRLLREPKLCRQFGEAGRRRVETTFHIERTVQAYERLYCELCHNQRTR